MTLTLLAAALAAFPSQTAEPKALLNKLQATLSEARGKAYRRETVDLPAVEADVKAQAAALLEGLDPSKLPDAQADVWSDLYALAGRKAEATTLNERAFRYYSMQAWGRQQALLSAYIEQGDKAKILGCLAYAQGTSVPMIGQLGEPVVFSITSKYGESDPAFVLQAYDTLLRRFDLNRPMAPDQLAWTRFAVARLGANRDAVLYRTGKKAEAQADLKRLHALVKGDERAESAVTEVENRLSLTQVRPAPEIVTERAIGAYPGLVGLKGKVVLLDFFAHWCGPCKRAFPDMRTMYAADRAKGLEIVGVTSFQGYYGDQQGVKPDAEFALMRDKFVPEFKLPWPVVFEKGKTASKAYGVSGIPHLVVIDRKGMVRRILVGYTPEEFKATRAYVESLLAER